jgi:hypothetical protein
VASLEYEVKKAKAEAEEARRAHDMAETEVMRTMIMRRRRRRRRRVMMMRMRRGVVMSTLAPYNVRWSTPGRRRRRRSDYGMRLRRRRDYARRSWRWRERSMRRRPRR